MFFTGKSPKRCCGLWRLWPGVLVLSILSMRQTVVRLNAIGHASFQYSTTQTAIVSESRSRSSPPPSTPPPPRPPINISNDWSVEEDVHPALDPASPQQTVGNGSINNNTLRGPPPLNNPHKWNVEERQIYDRIQPRAFPFSIFLQPKWSDARSNRDKGPNAALKTTATTMTAVAAALPCFPPDPNWRIEKSTTDKGLLFCKPTKVGSSTAAGVHLRIARNAADRQRQNYHICHNSWQHGPVRKRFPNRDKAKSLLWTVLRDPTRRLVSLFYHFKVSVQGVKATAANFRKHSMEKGIKHLMMYQDWVSFQRGSNHTAMIESILYDYDFVAVTERMDESVVALAILWGIPLADVLYLSAKRFGNYDGGARGACFPILNGEIVHGMQEVIDSEEFQSMIRLDRIAHQLANRSLDKTIDETIGRDRFNQAYGKFRRAMKVAQERCTPEVIAPCTNGGIGKVVVRYRNTTSHQFMRKPRKYKDTDCLAIDSGCGYMCLDDVAAELNLWDQAAPMQYRFPDAFGLGPSSRQRLATKTHTHTQRAHLA